MDYAVTMQQAMLNKLVKPALKDIDDVNAQMIF
jgi:hypothetical protein